MLKYITTLLLASSFLFGNAQKVNLKFKIKGLQQDSAVYLGNYLGKSLYYYDTAYVKKNGVVEFLNIEAPTGVYALITQTTSPVKYFEFLVNKENIEMEGDNNNLRESIVIKQSTENKIFFDYVNYLNKQSGVKKPLVDARNEEGITEAKKEELTAKIKAIDDAVVAYQKNLIQTHKDKYVGKLVNMSMEPDAPIYPEGGVKDSALFRYQYYRAHYFDKIDLTNDGLARTPIFHQKIDDYFMKVVPQDPDTIAQEVFELTDKMNPDGDMFKYTVNHLTYAHVKTKRMGMDKVYFRMAEKYYLTGRTPWASESTIEKMKEDVNKLKNILIGNYAPNIILPDTTEKNYISMYKDVQAKYTLLYFWDWTCGHCKKETPKLKEFYDSIKKNTSYDIEVYAVCTKEDNSGWITFINEHNLNWINVSDAPDMTSKPEKYGMDIQEIDGQKTLMRNDNGITLNYRTTYDVFVTPQLFLLDKDKKILAKQISIEQVGDLLNVLEGNKP